MVKPLVMGIVGGVIAVAIVAFFVFNGVSTEIEQRKALENVEISLYDINLNDVGFSGISLHLVLDMYNPNDVTATLDRADFDVWVNENFVGTGHIEDRVDIPSQTIRKATTDFDANFYGTLKSGLSAILEKQIRLKISGEAHYDTILGTLDIPFTVSRDFGGLSNDNSESSNNFESKTDSYSEPVDSDGDGLLDAVDNCPYDSGLMSNYGCPVVSSSKIPTEFVSNLDWGQWYNAPYPSEICISVKLVDLNGQPLRNESYTWFVGTGKDGVQTNVDEYPHQTDENGFAVNECMEVGATTFGTEEMYWFEFKGNEQYLPIKSGRLLFIIE